MRLVKGAIPKPFIVPALMHNRRAEKLLLLCSALTPPLLGISPRLFHRPHSPLLNVLEDLYSPCVAGCIDQVKVHGGDLRMKHDGRTHPREASGLLYAHHVGTHYRGLAILYRQTLNRFPEPLLAEESNEAGMSLCLWGVDESPDVAGHEVNQNFARMMLEERPDEVQCQPGPACGIEEDERKAAATRGPDELENVGDGIFELSMPNGDLDIAYLASERFEPAERGSVPFDEKAPYLQVVIEPGMCLPRAAKLFERDRERAVRKIVRTYVPRSGEAVHVGERGPFCTYDVQQPLKVMSEHEVLDEGLLTTRVHFVTAHSPAGSFSNSL